jgi:DNA-binding LacI/PurR family transcriptional regulator
VIIPFVTHPSFVDRLRGIQSALDDQENEFNLILYSVNEPDRWDEQLLTIVKQAAIDGVLIAALNVSDEQRDLLIKANIPFVMLKDVSTGELRARKSINSRN